MPYAVPIFITECYLFAPSVNVSIFRVVGVINLYVFENYGRSNGRFFIQIAIKSSDIGGGWDLGKEFKTRSKCTRRLNLGEEVFST